jgi:hypothetical protein
VGAGDPNNAGGAFQARLEGRAGDYFEAQDTSSPLFIAGVTAGLRAKEQELVTGVFAANAVGESGAVDAGNTEDGDFAAFTAAVPSDNNFAELEGFLSARSIDLDHGPACVILARESDDVPTTLLREGVLATDCAVIDAGVLTRIQLEHVVKTYNDAPWTTKEGFDDAVKGAPLDKPVEADKMMENPMRPSAKAQAPPQAAAAAKPAAPKPLPTPTPISELSHEYIVYNNDACLGKGAPSLSSLDVMHNGVEGAAAPNLDYAANTATIVCFWSKIHKGNYPTINTWSDIASRYTDQGVTFVGVARDTDPAQVGKYIKRIGDHAPTLGENGIWLSGGIALAYDAGSQVNMGFKAASQMKTVGVDNAFIVDKAGKIVWRAKFNRGKEPTGMFEAQIKRIVSGEEVLLNNEPPAESSGEDEPEEDTGADKEALAGLMGADY